MKRVIDAVIFDPRLLICLDWCLYVFFMNLDMSCKREKERALGFDERIIVYMYTYLGNLKKSNQ
jgi:hypothetical protein